MMNTYLIGRNELPFDPNAEFFIDETEFTHFPAAAIVNYPWDTSGYCPLAYAFVSAGENGFRVLMCAREAVIAANETRCGGEVYKDSCLEFFLNPCPSFDRRYVNMEINPMGVAHIGFGESREARKVLKQLPEGFLIEHSVHKGAWWAVCYTVSFAFLRSLYGREPEREMLGNFYKCDESIHPHFGTWNPVIAPQPDFHRPECFGRLLVWEK